MGGLNVSPPPPSVNKGEMNRKARGKLLFLRCFPRQAACGSWHFLVSEVAPETAPTVTRTWILVPAGHVTHTVSTADWESPKVSSPGFQAPLPWVDSLQALLQVCLRLVHSVIMRSGSSQQAAGVPSGILVYVSFGLEGTNQQKNSLQKRGPLGNLLILVNCFSTQYIGIKRIHN